MEAVLPFTQHYEEIKHVNIMLFVNQHYNMKSLKMDIHTVDNNPLVNCLCACVSETEFVQISYLIFKLLINY